MYRFAVGLHTTTNMTPQEIHDIGLREVARIRGEMQSIIDTLGYKGSMEEFTAVFAPRSAILLQDAGRVTLGLSSFDKTH